jgi:hypothetical protein
VVLVFLRAADQDRAVAVEPRKAGLDDPAASPPAGAAGLELDLVTARADVRRESVGAEQLERVGVVVGPVEADALRLLLGRGGPLDRERLERALQQLVVVALGALVIEPDRDSLPFAEERPFRPLLALSVGFGPVFGPPKGAIGHCTVGCQPGPVDPDHLLSLLSL